MSRKMMIPILLAVVLAEEEPNFLTKWGQKAKRAVGLAGKPDPSYWGRFKSMTGFGAQLDKDGYVVAPTTENAKTSIKHYTDLKKSQ